MLGDRRPRGSTLHEVHWLTYTALGSHTHDMHMNLSSPMLYPDYCRAVLYELQTRAVASVHNGKLDHKTCSNHTTAYAGVCHNTHVLTWYHRNVYLCISVFDTSEK